jgi:hypothetical protein
MRWWLQLVLFCLDRNLEECLMHCSENDKACRGTYQQHNSACHTHIYKQPASTNSQDACDIQWLCYPLHLWKSIARHTGVEMHKSSLIPFWNEAPVASVAFFLFGTRLQRRLVTACPESRWVHFFFSSRYHLGGSHANMFFFFWFTEDGHLFRPLLFYQKLVWVWIALSQEVTFKALLMLESVIALCHLSARLEYRYSHVLLGRMIVSYITHSVKRATCQ